MLFRRTTHNLEATRVAIFLLLLVPEQWWSFTLAALLLLVSIRRPLGLAALAIKCWYIGPDLEPGNRPLTRRLRLYVLERDHYCCVACGHQVTWATAEIDHWLPRWKFPWLWDAKWNLRTTCTKDNQEKSGKCPAQPYDWEKGEWMQWSDPRILLGAPSNATLELLGSLPAITADVERALPPSVPN